ncbi:MAG TPA: pitrilysin family protein [Vicinamibacterales bacterium]|jgi:zinc protease|nr:pitrilysin family protein [Vicinamibacterales bacterium]
MRRTIILALVLLAAPLSAQAPAPPTAVPAKLEVPYRLFTLANGLTVILHQDRSVPIVAVNIWYHVGSANEHRGRTGFAHLFEHLMFEGSKNVKEGEFDNLLEAAGGNNNGSTTNDRTNYVIDVPSNALELALYLESDRMGYLLDAMSPERVNGQRDVVKNERRQSYENRPYGMAEIELDQLLWPENHPYSWPTIGSMEDLTAASYEDVVAFFKKYYAPNNASLVIAGDIDLDRTQALVHKWFDEVPRGKPVEPVAPPAALLTTVTRKTMTDDQARLPRVYLAWITPRMFAPGDAALDVVSSVLAGGKNSRLYKRLVYDTQMAQDVSAFQQSGALGSEFTIVATARPGKSVTDIQKVIDEEMDRLRKEPPQPREVERAVNQIEANFYRGMERVGGFEGKANQLNAYYTAGGGPDYFAEDLARYTSLSPSDVQAAAIGWLPADRRVELIVEPEAQK